MKSTLILFFIGAFLLCGILLGAASNSKRIEKATEQVQAKKSIEFAPNAFLF